MNRSPVGKCIYIRTASDIANDDDVSDSVMFPVSAIRGVSYYDNTSVLIYHEAPYQYVGTDIDNTSFILFTITAGKHKEFMKELAEEIAFGDNYMITIGDDVTEEYFGTYVTTVQAITVNVTDD